MPAMSPNSSICVGLRVVSSGDSQPCTLRDSILRNGIFAIGYLISGIFWFGWIVVLIAAAVEFIILLGSKDGMRIGDEIAKTIVIDSPQIKLEE